MATMIPCPKCKVRLQAPDNLLGKTIHCPKCKKPVKLVVRGNGVAPAALSKPAVPAPEKTPAAPPNPPAKASLDDDDFIAGLEQVEDLDAPANAPPEPKQATPSAADDDVEKMMEEAVGEEAAEEVKEDEVKDQAAEETVEETTEDVVEEEAVEEEAAEEEEEETGKLSKAVEKFMAAKLFLIKGQSGIFSMNAAWDFLNPDTKKKVGSAVERPEGALQALRFFLRRNWLPSKIEVREEKTNELVFVVKRPAYFFNCTLEVRDANNKLLAKFTYKPLSRMVGKPMPVERKGGDKFATCEFYFLKGRVDLMDDKKKELANMQTESAYTKAIKIYWAPRGGSYYVTFNKPLFDKPHDKMIFLGVTLAMDLMQEDSKASAGKGGISIGT